MLHLNNECDFHIYTSFVFYMCETFIKSLDQLQVSDLHCPLVSYLLAFHVSFCPNRYIKAEGRVLIKKRNYRFMPYIGPVGK
jgi:hypothetical protein